MNTWIFSHSAYKRAKQITVYVLCSYDSGYEIMAQLTDDE